MKFLGISKTKDTVSTLPPSVTRQLMEATLDLMNQEKKAGRILEAYHIPGWDRVVTISEFKNAEEMNQFLSELPIGAFLDIETYPMANFNESMKTYIESLKTAEKMFPGPPK